MKKYARLWIMLLLSVLTIYGLVSLGNIEISTRTLAQVNWRWYLMVVISYYASIFARGWRWQSLLKIMGRPVSFAYATALLTTGLFLSAILPARAGDIGRVAMLKQDHKIPIAQGLASIAGERALDVFSILSMAFIGAMLALPGRIPAEIMQLMLGGVLLFFVGLAGLFIMPGIQPWLRELKLLKIILPAKIWAIYQKVLDFGFSLIHSVRQLGHNPSALVFTIGQSFFIWLWDALMIYFILLSLGIIAPFSVSLFSAMVSDLATAVPITPGSLGQFEAVLISLLSLFGLSTTQGSLTALLLRLVQLWTFIPISALVTYIFGFTRVLNLNRSDFDTSQVELTPAAPGSSLAES